MLFALSCIEPEIGSSELVARFFLTASTPTASTVACALSHVRPALLLLLLPVSCFVGCCCVA
jgi:hypothetical protein